MLGNVKTELLPIMVMDSKHVPVSFKESWMAEDGLFVVKHDGRDVILEKEDFFFFGRRAGGRYFSTFDLDGNRCEYSMLTGAKTLRVFTDTLNVKVTVGEDITAVTHPADLPVKEEVGDLTQSPNEDSGEEVIEHLCKVSEDYSGNLVREAKPEDGEEPGIVGVRTDLTEEVLANSSGMASVVFGATKEPLECDEGGASNLIGQKLYHFDEKGQLVYLRTIRKIYRGQFASLLIEKGGGLGAPLINPLSGESLGTYNHKVVLDHVT